MSDHAKDDGEIEHEEVPPCPACGNIGFLLMRYEKTERGYTRVMHCPIPIGECRIAEYYATERGDCSRKDGRFEEYEEKIDELNEGLLTAYAAGFAKAMETFDVDTDLSSDAELLRQHEYVSENHYYFWDGRTKPLEFWLEDHYGIGSGVRPMPSNDGAEYGDGL